MIMNGLIWILICYSQRDEITVPSIDLCSWIFDDILRFLGSDDIDTK